MDTDIINPTIILDVDIHSFVRSFIHSFTLSFVQQLFIDCQPCTNRHCVNMWKVEQWFDGGKVTVPSKGDLTWSENAFQVH